MPLFGRDSLISLLSEGLVGFRKYEGTLFIFIITVQGFLLFLPIIYLIRKKFIFIIYIQTDIFLGILFKP